MPSETVTAGRNGGKIGCARNTLAQQAVWRRNGFQPRKAEEPGAAAPFPRTIATPAPTNRKPSPAPVPDEFNQGESTDDFTS